MPNQADLTQYGHLGVDDYYQQRTLDVFGRMKQQAFWLTFKQGALESRLAAPYSLEFPSKSSSIACFCSSIACFRAPLEHALELLSLLGFVLLFGTFGVLLSTFDQTELAMICLSLAASLQSLEKFHALSTRLDAANTGERDMWRGGDLERF